MTASWTIGDDASSHYDSGFGLRVNGIAVTADSYTLNLAGLPAHSMMQVQVDEDAGPWYVDNGSGTFKVDAGSSTQTTSLSSYSNSYSYSHRASADFGKWAADSSSNLSITLSAEDFTRRCGYFVPDVTVAVYQPTVSISGGGTAVEDGSGDGAWFEVSRDGSGNLLSDPLQVHIQGTTQGGSAGQAIAQPGTDYELPLDLTIPAGQNTKKIWVAPKNDDEAEGIEMIFAKVTPASSSYNSTATPASAQIDDDVSVKSITISRDTLDTGGFHNAYGYRFGVEYLVVGEHLDQILIKQQIKSKTRVWNWDGTEMTRAQVLALYGTADPVVIDSDGQFEIDTNWDWWGLSELSNHNGLGKANDVQQVPVVNTRNVTTSIGIVEEGQLTSSSSDYIVQLKESGTASILKEITWGYVWSNQNALWSPNGMPPAPDPCCVLDDTNKHGEFNGVYGIGGLPWI